MSPTLAALAVQGPGSPSRPRGRLPSIDEHCDGALPLALRQSQDCGPRTPPPPDPADAAASDAAAPSPQPPGDAGSEGSSGGLESLEEALDSAFDRWCGGRGDAAWPPSLPAARGAAPPPHVPLPFQIDPAANFGVNCRIAVYSRSPLG